MVKKIFLTGSGGFIGKNIKESFLAEKYEITSPRSFELNLLDTEAVDEYFKDKHFDVILHSGCKPGHRNAKDLTNLFYSNVRMFENLARQSEHFDKFINFGSGAIYDMCSDITDAKETDMYQKMGKDDHSFCKYVVGKRIDSLFNEDKKFIDMNIFGIFGKYEDWEIRFPSNSICKALYGLPITLRQNRKFSYLFVEDLMPILEFFIENDTKYSTYNICPDVPTSILEVAQTVKKISGKDIEIKVAKEGFGYDYTGDNSRLHAEFKDLKFTNLEDALRKLYSYYENINDKIDKKLLLEDK